MISPTKKVMLLLMNIGNVGNSWEERGYNRFFYIDLKPSEQQGLSNHLAFKIKNFHEELVTNAAFYGESDT